MRPSTRPTACEPGPAVGQSCYTTPLSAVRPPRCYSSAASTGTALGSVLPEPEQDTIVVARPLRQLWSTSAEGHPFRSLQVICDGWAAEFEQRLARSPGVADLGLARSGIELFRSLPATTEWPG